MLFVESLFILKLRFIIKKKSYCFNRFYLIFNVVLTSVLVYLSVLPSAARPSTVFPAISDVQNK